MRRAIIERSSAYRFTRENFSSRGPRLRRVSFLCLVERAFARHALPRFALVGRKPVQPRPLDRLAIRPLARPEVERVASVLGLARLYQGDGYYLVAWEHDQPLGHAYLALSEPAQLQDVQVREQYRRCGVASALTAAAEDDARERGFKLIRLGVSIDNLAAQALYRGRGRVDSGLLPKRVHGTVQIRTGPIEVDDTFLIWEKRLG